MSKFTLSCFTDVALLATKSNWLAFGDESLAVNSRLFENIQAHIGNEDKDHESIYYGLFESGNDFAVAIVEVVTSPKAKGTVTKILNVDLSPKLWDISTSRRDIIDIYVSLIPKSLGLSTKKKKGYLLKLYGRTTEFLSVLYSVHVAIAENKPASIKKIDMDGRWLVIEHA